MKDIIKRKLRSRQGVTLILSLLAFLVCAMAASVLITAGSASSGTVSQRAKMDQRYFSVTSAVELLRKAFSEASVNSVEVKVKYDKNDAWTGSSIKVSDSQFVTDQSLYALSALGDTDWRYGTDADTLKANAKKWISMRDESNQWVSRPYRLTVDGEGLSNEDKDILKAIVEVRYERPEQPDDQPGKLQFVVNSAIRRKGEEEDERETFSLKVQYVASVLKEVKTTAEGKEIVFRADWKIGAVS